MFNQKGQIRIIEAFLSIAVVFSGLLISVTFPAPPNFTKQKMLASLGAQVLQQLDSDGTLGNLVTQKKWTDIKAGLDASLPAGVSFNLTIYDDNMSPLNSQLIQNTSLLSQETISVQYICATQTGHVQFFVLRLQLAWRS